MSAGNSPLVPHMPRTRLACPPPFIPAKQGGIYRSKESLARSRSWSISIDAVQSSRQWVYTVHVCVYVDLPPSPSLSFSIAQLKRRLCALFLELPTSSDSDDRTRPRGLKSPPYLQVGCSKCIWAEFPMHARPSSDEYLNQHPLSGLRDMLVRPVAGPRFLVLALSLCSHSLPPSISLPASIRLLLVTGYRRDASEKWTHHSSLVGAIVGREVKQASKGLY